MVSATLYCDACGMVNRREARFCFSCGQSLQAISSLQQTPAARPLPGSLTGTGHLVPDHLLKQRYRILCQLGRGGMGTVYKAEDIQFGNRLVAVKEMSQDGLRAEETAAASEAFKREALMLAGLMHPHLPRTYDHFFEGARWYLVMDFIDGRTLEEYLSKAGDGRLPLDEVLDIGLQLCTILGYLHSCQPPIIFRDLKPANVMLTPAGHIYLFDFGIARHFKPGQAKDTAIFGSMGYAAPEQYGKAQTTPRSDIYSLGATLHQLLSGSDPSQTPFLFRPLRLQTSPLPVELDELIIQMVNVDENKRPASMVAIKQELQRIVLQRTAGQGSASQAKGGALFLHVQPASISPSIGTTLTIYRGHSRRVLAVAWSHTGRSSQGAKNASKNEKEHMMKFINVRLLTGDFPAALRFWRDIMRLTMTYGDETMGYAYFETGDSGVELFSRDGFAASLGEATPAPQPQGHQAVLVFRMDDVDAAYSDLVARGAASVSAPQDRPAWQVRTAHFKAHDGYLVEIYSPLGGSGTPTA